MRIRHLTERPTMFAHEKADELLRLSPGASLRVLDDEAISSELVPP
jgi:hypothetical protein